MANEANRGAMPQPGATGRIETAPDGMQWFVTAEGLRIPLGAAPAVIDAGAEPIAVVEGGNGPVRVFSGASTGGVVVTSPSPGAVVTPGSNAGGMDGARPGVVVMGAPGDGAVVVQPSASNGVMDGSRAGAVVIGAPGAATPMPGPGAVIMDASAPGVVVLPGGATVDPGATVVLGGIAPAPGTVLTRADGQLLVMPGGPRPGADIFTTPVSGRHAGEPEVRSEELQEIIGTIPHWVVRWGITVMFATVAALLGVSWFVRYPDVVNGRVTLTTPQPPARIAASLDGEIEKVLAPDGSVVARGAPLAVIRSSADYGEVFALAAEMERFERAGATPAAWTAARFGAGGALGDVQSAYAVFLQSLSDYRSFSGAGYYAGKVSELQRQVAEQERLSGALAAKQALLEQGLGIAERNRDRARTLARQSFISQEELGRAEADYIQHRTAVQDGRGAITANEIQLSSLRSQVLDVRKTGDDEGRNSLLAMRTAFAALKSAVARWDQQYVLRAPAAGRVSHFRGLAEHELAKANDPLMVLLPQARGVVGRLLVSETGAGKVELGQAVLIRLESYPSREFGLLRGRVTAIAPMPFQRPDKDESMYLVDVSIPDPLVTTYRKPIQFRQEMRGQAQIVTRDLRLLERVFGQFRDLLDNAGRR